MCNSTSKVTGYWLDEEDSNLGMGRNFIFPTRSALKLINIPVQGDQGEGDVLFVGKYLPNREAGAVVKNEWSYNSAQQ
jgi:hypothetical protein